MHEPKLSLPARYGHSLFISIVIITTLYLASCSTHQARGTADSAHTNKAHSSIGTKGGGYYLDDGPGHNPPANIDDIPNAVPRKEQLRSANMSPYVALGKKYTPMTKLKSYKERGYASWYGRRYHGKNTASGEIYDMYAMTAAHPTLPIPSYARVTHLQNGKSVIVRINDRGPFLSNRLIDLSYVAAYKLDILANGSELVEVESIIPGQAGVHPGNTQSQAPTEKNLSIQEDSIYLQLAAFGSAHNAQNYLSQLQADFPSMTQQSSINETSGLYKVLIGPFADQLSATQAADFIAKSVPIKPIFIRHSYMD